MPTMPDSGRLRTTPSMNMLQIKSVDNKFGGPKTLTQPAMKPLKQLLRELAKSQGLCVTCPSEMMLTRIVRGLLGTTATIPGLKGPAPVRDVIKAEVRRKGLSAITLDPDYAVSIYQLALVKLGVHVGKYTRFDNYKPAFVFAREIRKSGKPSYYKRMLHVAKLLYQEGKTSPDGRIEVKVSRQCFSLHVAPPEYFVGAMGEKKVDRPDIFLGQLINRKGQAASPAIQLSLKAQILLELLVDRDLKATDLQITRALESNPAHHNYCRLGTKLTAWIPAESR